VVVADGHGGPPEANGTLEAFGGAPPARTICAGGNPERLDVESILPIGLFYRILE
jgi:hypothetical protein